MLDIFSRTQTGVNIPNNLFITLEWVEHGSSKTTARNHFSQSVPYFKMLLIIKVEAMEAL